MHAGIEIDTDRAEHIQTVLAQSLENNKKIGYSIETGNDVIKIDIDTESLGQLRGCTDTVFRLATLSKKILER